MFWLWQTRRAFQRQHEDGGDYQRKGACQQRTLAAGVGRRSCRITHCSNVGVVYPEHLSTPAQSAPDRSRPGFGHPGARPPP